MYHHHLSLKREGHWGTTGGGSTHTTVFRASGETNDVCDHSEFPCPLYSHNVRSWCVLPFRVSKQCYRCQRLGFLTCTQMSMHVIAQGDCADTVKESALKADTGRKNSLPHRGAEPVSAASCTWCSANYLPTQLHSNLERRKKCYRDDCQRSEKDQKHTKAWTECFLIRQNKTRCKF